MVPSETDDANAELWAIQTKNEFARIENENLVSYVNGISDQPFDAAYYSIEDLDPLLSDSLISQPDGEVFGPYFEDDAYKLSRVKDSQMRPDSVRARHILIGYSVVGDIRNFS